MDDRVDDRESRDGPLAEPTAARGLSRRRFIERTGVTAGGVIALGMAGSLPVLEDARAATVTTPSAPMALTADEMATLRAILARLIPNDELGPGAVESGVDVYIDRALAGAYADLLPAYRQSLAAINKGAGAMGAASFAALAPQRQDALLQQVEAGKLGTKAGKKVRAGGKRGGGGSGVALMTQQFFPILLQHTREGMFGDPMYGGNRQFAGWNLVGYQGIKLVWTAEEQAIGAKVPLAHQSDAAYGGHPAP